MVYILYAFAITNSEKKATHNFLVLFLKIIRSIAANSADPTDVKKFTYVAKTSANLTT